MKFTKSSKIRLLLYSCAILCSSSVPLISTAQAQFLGREVHTEDDGSMEQDRPAFLPRLSSGGVEARARNYRAADLAPDLQESSTFELGRFILQPSAAVRASYDDNIDASGVNERDDFILSADAGLRLQSRFRRHALGAAADFGYDQFLENDGKSGGRVRFVGDGRLDFTRATQAVGAVSYVRDQENPESAEFRPSDDGDGRFQVFGAEVGMRQELSVTDWGLDVGFNRRVFDDSVDSDRDRFEYRGLASVERDITRRTSLGLEGQYRERDYDEVDRFSGLNRDERRFRALGIGSYHVSDRLRAEASLGYSYIFRDDPSENDQQGAVVGIGFDYLRDERLRANLALLFDGAEAADFDDVDTIPISVDAGIDYVAGKNTRFGFGLFRTVADTEVGTSSRKVVTGAEANVVYLLSADTSLTGGAGAALEQFDEEDRTDESIFAELTWSWAFTRRAQLDVSYRYSQRFSDQDQNDFTRNIATVGFSTLF